MFSVLLLAKNIGQFGAGTASTAAENHPMRPVVLRQSFATGKALAAVLAVVGEPGVSAHVQVQIERSHESLKSEVWAKAAGIGIQFVH